MTRVVKLLGAELDRRRPMLAALDVQAENLSAYLDKGRSLPRIVVLIDGFQNLSALLGNVRPMEFGPLDWFGELQRIITDGRQLGIHAILTTDRRAAVPALVMSALGARLVLRQTDEAGYGEYSIPSGLSRGIELPNGRGIWDGQLVQIGGDRQRRQGGRPGRRHRRVRGLARDESSQLRCHRPPRPIGCGSRSSPAPPSTSRWGAPTSSARWSRSACEHTGLCVVGPARSGRSTALAHVARSLVAAGHEVWTVGLGDDIGGPGRHAPARSDPMLELVEDFAALCEAMPKAQPYILVVDDLDRYDQSALPATYDRIVKTERSRLIGSIEWRNLSGYTQNSMLLELRREPTMLILQPDSAGDVLQMTGVRAQLRPGLPMAAGRGILIAHRQPTLLQVASDADADAD